MLSARISQWNFHSESSTLKEHSEAPTEHHINGIHANLEYTRRQLESPAKTGKLIRVTSSGQCSNLLKARMMLRVLHEDMKKTHHTFQSVDSVDVTIEITLKMERNQLSVSIINE